MGRIIAVTLPASTAGGRSAFGLFLGGLWQSLPKSKLRRLSGLQEHVALEVYGDTTQISYQLWTPTPAVGQVIARQAKAHFPEVELQAGDDLLMEGQALATAELRLGQSRERSLRTLKASDPDPTAGLLAGLSGLGRDEWGLIQILVRPSLVCDLDTPVFECLIRVAAASRHPGGAQRRLSGLISAFGQFAEANNLSPARIKVNDQRELTAIRSRHWPAFGIHHALLTRDELAAIYHFPAPSEIRNRYLHYSAARRLPLLASAPASGVCVGQVAGGSRPVIARIAAEDLLRHMLVIGATGTGKSTLLCNQALDLVDLGLGLTVMEPHGSLISAVAARVPERRLKDVILVRFADVTYPVGLNFLSARPGFEFLTVDELVEVCQRIYANSYWGPVLDMTIRHSAYATLETGGTLLEMARLLDDEGYRQAVTRRVRNPETRRFLLHLSEMREARREQQAASTLHRLQRFLGTPFIRNIVGQSQSSLDIRQIMDLRKILLLDLSGIGVDNAKFLGSLLTLLFRQAALSRQEIPEEARVPHYLIMDECSWFLSKSVGEMADQARKFKLGLILAAQRLSQLKIQGVLEAILAEANSLICFRMGDVQEARYLAQHLNTADLTAEEIRSLGQYEVYAQILQRGAQPPAFWAQTPPPAPVREGQAERHNALVRQSRQDYARPRQVVEAEIAARERSALHVEPEKRIR